jgi:hypothetical protein
MLVLVVLALASLACLSLRKKTEEAPTATPLDSVAVAQTAAASNPGSNAPPVVQVIEPGDGQQVAVGQSVDVRVRAEHPIGVTRIQLSVDGRIASSKSLPPNSTGVDVLLGWLPDRTGNFSLEVLAFYNTLASQPATVNLQVLTEGAIASNPASGQSDQVTPVAGTCSARVVISQLNMRQGPGESFARIRAFDLNEQLAVTGRNTDERGQEWLKIRRVDGQEGWVIRRSEWLETQGDCNNLPTVAQ